MLGQYTSTVLDEAAYHEAKEPRWMSLAQPAVRTQVFMGEYGDPHLAKDPAALQRDLQKAQALVKDQSNPFAARKIGVPFVGWRLDLPFAWFQKETKRKPEGNYLLEVDRPN